MSTNSLAFWDTNLEGIGRSPAPMASGVSVMVDESVMSSSPSCLIC